MMTEHNVDTTDKKHTDFFNFICKIYYIAAASKVTSKHKKSPGDTERIRVFSTLYLHYTMDFPESKRGSGSFFI